MKNAKARYKLLTSRYSFVCPGFSDGHVCFSCFTYVAANIWLSFERAWRTKIIITLGMDERADGQIVRLKVQRIMEKLKLFLAQVKVCGFIFFKKTSQ